MEVFMHYLAPSADGPIRSQYREVKDGSQTVVLSPECRYRLACKPDRAALGVGTGRGRRFKLVDATYAFATGTLFRRGPEGGPLEELVSCPRCRASELYQRDEAAQRALWAPPPAQTPGGVPSLS